MFPIFLIPFVDFINIPLRVVNPIFLWPVEKIGIIPTFGNCYVFVGRIFSISGDLTDFVVNLL